MTKGRLLAPLITVLVGAAAAAAAVGAPTVYVPLGHGNAVAVIDAGSDRVVGRIEGVDNAHGLAVDPQGRVLVAGSLAERAKGEAPERPQGMSAEEHRAHHAGGHETGKAAAAERSGTLYVIDPAERTVKRAIDVRGAVHHVAVAPDARYAIATHPKAGGVSVTDLNEGREVAFIETGPAPNYALISADGASVYVSNAGNDAVSVIDAGGWKVRRDIAIGSRPEHMALSPDGRTLYTANSGDGSVSVVDLDAGKVSRTLSVGGELHGIDVSDDGGTLYAVSKSEERVVASARSRRRRITLPSSRGRISCTSRVARAHASGCSTRERSRSAGASRSRPASRTRWRSWSDGAVYTEGPRARRCVKFQQTALRGDECTIGRIWVISATAGSASAGSS